MVSGGPRPDNVYRCSMKVGVVTGFIPIAVRHVTVKEYHDYGKRLAKASEGHTFYVGSGKLEDCWAYNLCKGLPPDMPVPSDRYEDAEANINSHIIQHQRTTWAVE